MSNDYEPPDLPFTLENGILLSKRLAKEPLQRQNIDQLLEHVEQHGLHIEGIYRKPGGAIKMRELRQRLENDPKVVYLENYSIYTITGLVKEWLREQPEPLMTFTHYSAFVHAMELPEEAEQLRQIYRVLDMLPPANIDLLKRILFHLVRVASEALNKMSIHSLAIVFAPSILRPADASNLLDIMKDITLCLELILNEEMRRYEKLKEGEHGEALANWSSLKRGRLHHADGRYDLNSLTCDCPAIV